MKEHNWKQREGGKGKESELESETESLDSHHTWDA